MPRSVLLITGDSIGPAMAGPGIRALQLANVLHGSHDVRVVTTGKYEKVEFPFDVHAAKSKQLRELAKNSDVIVVQGFVLVQFPWLKKVASILVVDLYDPMHLEQLNDSDSLTMGSGESSLRQTISVITEQVRYADFFMCASEKQRDFWLGYLSAVGRVNAETYKQDPSLRRLIDTVPFGLESAAPRQHGHGIRGQTKGISETDFVLLWGGGIYNWFDPLTLIRAINRVASARPAIRLFFMGTAHPNPHFRGYEMTHRAVELSDSLGLTGKHVFFNENWVPYSQRANYLLDADVGVSTHFVHLETQFSFRTRILDYLWAGLPILTTDGDGFADLVRDHELGLVVSDGDEEGLAISIQTMMDEKAALEVMRNHVKREAQAFQWNVVAKPLLSFIANAAKAADLAGGPTSVPIKPIQDSWWRAKTRALKVAYKHGGARLVWARFRSLYK